MLLTATVSPVESRRWYVLALLSTAELLGMSLWFSGAAVVPALQQEWHLSPQTVSWLTIAVQLGFVVGTLLSALFNLPDLINVRHLFAFAALTGAGANFIFGYFAQTPATAIALRFVTGMALAGVYPPGMKIMATWFNRSRGMAMGVLIGALTLGKALPYLINTVGSSNWRMNVLAVSLLASLGGAVVLLFVDNGPHAVSGARFDWKQAAKVFSNRGVRLASFGYFGHMWELYAMWAWLPVMMRVSLSTQSDSTRFAELASFLVIGCGAIGCVVGGLLADRIGRTLVTSWAMAISGSCCLLIGFAFGGSWIPLITIAAIWGASVIADSAQFSTCITELGDPQYLGTALTIQTCVGFLLTSFSIELVPKFVDLVGWRYAFIVLMPGPLLGTLAMLRLRQLPEARRIAQGRR